MTNTRKSNVFFKIFTKKQKLMPVQISPCYFTWDFFVYINVKIISLTCEFLNHSEVSKIFIKLPTNPTMFLTYYTNSQENKERRCVWRIRSFSKSDNSCLRNHTPIWLGNLNITFRFCFSKLMQTLDWN